jgi:PAS domain S-box-containing protein
MEYSPVQVKSQRALIIIFHIAIITPVLKQGKGIIATALQGQVAPAKGMREIPEEQTMRAEKQKTVLLVDDEAIIAMTEKMTLEKYGYNVMIAPTGEDAVATVAKTPAIDLVLMDVNLGSGIDGTEAAALILSNRDLPVVFLSSHMEPEVVTKTEKITSYGYVVKNSSITVLDASIKMAFKLFEAKKQEIEKEKALRESEASYRVMFSGASDGILLADSKTKVFRYANPAMCKMLGYTEEEFSRMSVADIHPKESLDHVLDEFAAMAQGEIVSAADLPCLRKDGTIFYANISHSAMVLEGCEYHAGFFHDVTERKRASDILRESELRLKAQYQGMPVPTFTWQKQGEDFELIEFNDAAKVITHEKVLEFVGRKASDLYANRKDILRDIQQCFAERKVIRKETASEHFVPGKLIALTIVPVPADLIMVHMEDITERKRSEGLLARQNDALLKLNRFSIELSMLSAEDNPEALIAKRIKEIAGAELAVFSEYDPEKRTTTIRHIEMEPGLLKKVVGLLGKQVEKIHSTVSAEMYQEMTREIIGTRKTLHEMSFGAISPPVGAAIQAMLKVDRFIGIAYLVEGKLYGTSVLAMNHDQPDPSQSILENFSYLASMSLRRKRAESQREAALEKLHSFALAVESSSDAIGMSTPDGKHYYQNKAFDDLFGDIGENPPATVYVDEQLGREVFRTIMGGNPWAGEIKMKGKAGELLDVFQRAYAIKDSAGRILGLVGVHTNITERKRAESQKAAALEKLRESEEKFRLMAEQLEDVLYTTDRNGIITYISPSAGRVFGWLPDEMTGRRFTEFLPQDEIPKAMQAFQAAVSEGKPQRNLQLMMKRRDDSVFYGEIIGSPLDKNRGMAGTLGLIRDISERRQTEIALYESEARYRTLVENASDLVYRTDTAGRFTFVNRATLTISGYEEKELIGKYYPSLIRPDMRNKAVRIFLHQIKEGAYNTYSEFPVITKDGRQLWLGQNIQLVLENGRVTGFQAVSRDITERKRIETALSESEDLYRDLVENSLDVICTHDLEGKVLSINQAAVRLTGYSLEDLLTMNMADLLMPEVRHLFKAYLAEIQAKGWAHGTMRVQTASGEPRYWEFHNTLRTKDVTIPVVRGVGRDITERERAEKEIKRQLAEKEILLKEVHHRIKNNIASIGGLISLHMQSVSNPEAVAVLQEAIGRVDSMRILYDKLLITDDFRDISVKNYIESLADAVLALFPDRAKIKLEKQIDDFYLDPKQLFPLGLIINELITNKMKYAFIAREAGRITISLKNVAKHVTLDIRDNGNKLPAGFDIDKTKGFGLMLVKMLSQQLGGSFSIEKHKGTRCTVEFDI